MRKLLCRVTSPLHELLLATAGDVLNSSTLPTAGRILLHVTALLGSPPQTEDMSSNNLSYLLG